MTIVRDLSFLRPHHLLQMTMCFMMIFGFCGGENHHSRHVNKISSTRLRKSHFLNGEKLKDI